MQQESLKEKYICVFYWKIQSIPASTKATDDECPLKKMMQYYAVVPGAQTSRLELKTSNFPALLIFSGFQKFPIQQLWGAALPSGSHSQSMGRPWPWCSPRDVLISFAKEARSNLASFCTKLPSCHLGKGDFKPCGHPPCVLKGSRKAPRHSGAAVARLLGNKQAIFHTCSPLCQGTL